MAEGEVAQGEVTAMVPAISTPPPPFLTIGPLSLKCVSQSHPEEWEFYAGVEEVGFAQLIDELFRVHSPNSYGRVIYGANLDASKHGYGSFASSTYRYRFLHQAAVAVCAVHGIPFIYQEGKRKWDARKLNRQCPKK